MPPAKNSSPNSAATWMRFGDICRRFRKNFEIALSLGNRSRLSMTEKSPARSVALLIWSAVRLNVHRGWHWQSNRRYEDRLFPSRRIVKIGDNLGFNRIVQKHSLVWSHSSVRGARRYPFLCSSARYPMSLRYRAPSNRTFGAASYAFASASESVAARAQTLATRPATLIILSPR